MLKDNESAVEFQATPYWLQVAQTDRGPSRDDPAAASGLSKNNLASDLLSEKNPRPVARINRRCSSPSRIPNRACSGQGRRKTDGT